MLFGFELPFADQPLPWLSWLLAGCGVIVIGIAKSGFGGGLGVLAVPLFVLAMGEKPGLGTLLPLLIAADIFSVRNHWRGWDHRNLRHLMPGSLVGIAAGAALLWWMVGGPELALTEAQAEAAEAGERRAKATLSLAIGLLCILYILLDVVRLRLAPRWRYDTGPIKGGFTGFAAGVVSTLVHAAGPIATIYMLGQHLPKAKLVGTAVIYFFTVNTIKLAPYFYLGLIDTSTLWKGLWLLPLVPLGTALGMKMHGWMSEGVFRTIVFFMLAITGGMLIRDAIAAMGLW